MSDMVAAASLPFFAIKSHQIYVWRETARSCIITKNSEISSSEMERSTLIGRTKINRSILTNQFAALLPFRGFQKLFTYVEDRRKEKKLVRTIPPGRPALIGKCRPV